MSFNCQVSFVYQPVVACNESIFFIESLIRPCDVDGNPIPPSEYVNLFKDTVSFDLDVIRKVLRETAGCSSIISINVSTLSIADNGFVEQIIAMFHENKSRKFCLELTEYSDLNEDILETIAGNVARLRRGGVLIALDDFGSSFSSEKILFYVNFDYVKLDMFFVKGLSNNHVKFNLLLNTVNKIRNTYGYRIIIEGIEDSFTAELVKEIGKLSRAQIFMQGFFFHRPANWSEVKSKLCNDCLVDVVWMSKASLYEQLVFLSSKYRISTRNKHSDSLAITTELINCIKFILIGIDGASAKSIEMNKLIDESESLPLSGKKNVVDKLLDFIYNDNHPMHISPSLTQDDILLYCLDTSELLFAIRDEAGNHLYTNKRYDDFFGKSMTGVNIKSLSSSVSSAEAGQVEECIRHDQLTFSENKIHSAIEMFVVEGVDMYFETKREPIRLGSQKYILLSVEDVTESVIKDVHGKISPAQYIDPLTKVFTRNYLDVIDASSYSSCVFIDLDGFKIANDRNGHAYGDLILKSICQMLASVFRSTDAILRYGGDEIVILSSLDNIRKLTDRILSVRSLLERKFEGISFSFGICSLYDNINEAIEYCDKLMYKNKFSRKNKMLNVKC